MSYSDQDYRKTARRLLSGDNFEVSASAAVEHCKGGAKVQVWLCLDDYEVAETKTRE